MERVLLNNKPALATLRRASLLSEGVYIKDYSAGANVLLPHLSPLRDAVRLLCMEAEFEAQRNINGARAVNSLVSGIWRASLSES